MVRVGGVLLHGSIVGADHEEHEIARRERRGRLQVRARNCPGVHQGARFGRLAIARVLAGQFDEPIALCSVREAHAEHDQRTIREVPR